METWHKGDLQKIQKVSQLEHKGSSTIRNRRRRVKKKKKKAVKKLLSSLDNTIKQQQRSVCIA